MSMDELNFDNNNLPSKKINKYEELKKYEQVIEESIINIQKNFIVLGKALMRIKDEKLYKEDPLHNTWGAYVEYRVKSKLNQSVISDYISIVRMILANEDFKENDIIKLGYKKAKFIKTKYNTIMKEKDEDLKEKKLVRFHQVYQEIIDSSENIPYSTCKKLFGFVKPKKDKNQIILNDEINGIKVKYNKKKKKITIEAEQQERLNTLYHIITNIKSSDTNLLQTNENLVNVSNNLRGFIREIPKTEIHVHLVAIASVESVYELIQKNQLKDQLGIYSIEDVKKSFYCTSLTEMIKVFYLIQSCLKTEEDFAYLVKDVRNYFRRNSIYYAEVFFSPTKYLRNGMDFRKIMNTIDLETKRYYVEDKINIKLLIDVSRNFGLDNAMNNLDLVINTASDSIIGIGLGGGEDLEGADAENFRTVFQKAKANGLKVVAHAGEVVGAESIWNTIKILGAERIGHGISAIEDDELMEYLKEHQIPLEICPTSNVITRKYVQNMGEHPIKKFFDRGLMVTLNSDDPSIFGVELDDEYLNIYEHCGFSINQIIQLIKNNLYSTFLSDNFKKVYWEGVSKKIKSLKEKYNIK